VTTLETDETASFAVSASHALFADVAQSVVGTIDSASYSDYAVSASHALRADIADNAIDYSSSFETRITTDETDISNLQTDSGSFSTRVTTNETDIDNLQTDSGSFSTRVTTNETDIDNLETDSGSFSTRVTTNESDISTNLLNYTTDSGSVSTRITTLEGETDGAWTASDGYISRFGDVKISGSLYVSGSFNLGTEVSVTNISNDAALADNSQTDLVTEYAAKSYTDAALVEAASGSVFGSGSTGYIARWKSSASLEDSKIYDTGTSVGIGITTPEEELHVWNNISASAFYGDGEFVTGVVSSSYAPVEAVFSESISDRVTTNEIDIDNLETDSGSFSTRVTTNETDITNLETDSGSFSTRVTTLETDETASYADYATSASHALRADIADNAIDYSSSFEDRLTTDETDISNLQTDSGSFSTRVTANETDIDNLETDSGSFSTRVTTLETDETASYADYATSASHALRADIADSVVGTIESASFAQNAFDYSASFSTRITTDESDISTNETDISNLETDSGSFSTRITTVEELTGSYWTGSITGITREGNVEIDGDLDVTGILTAQEFHTSFVSYINLQVQ